MFSIYTYWVNRQSHKLHLSAQLLRHGLICDQHCFQLVIELVLSINCFSIVSTVRREYFLKLFVSSEDIKCLDTSASR